MCGKIKGIYKGFKYISKIFVVKEREMEIGHPTDVKHVAHIGVDQSSTMAPSWINEFKIGSDTTAKPTDIDQPATDITRIRSCTDIPNVTKKRRRKRSVSVAESSSTKSPRLSKTKAKNPDRVRL